MNQITKNQITIEQLNELIRLRFKTLGVDNYDWDIVQESNDPIIQWYITILQRKK